MHTKQNTGVSNGIKTGGIGIASGGDTVVFNLLDTFSVDDNAPLTNPLSANIGSWNVTNTNNALAISSGKLTIAGTTSVNGDGIISASGLSRANGLTMMFIFSAFDNGDPIIGFAPSSSLSITPIGLFVSDAPPASRHTPLIRFAVSISDYTGYAFVVFSTGSAIFGYDGSSWKFVFMERLTTTATIYPQINNHNEAAVNYSINGVGAAVLNIPSLASLQTDGKASPSANDTITHTANGVIECTHTFQAGETLEISFRRTDDNNRWILRSVHDTDTITLVKVESGGETVVATNSSLNLTTVGTTWYYIRFSGDTIIAGFDGESTDGTIFQYTSASFNNTATGAKVNLASSQFNSYPESVSVDLAAQLNAMLNKINF